MPSNTNMLDLVSTTSKPPATNQKGETMIENIQSVRERNNYKEFEKQLALEEKREEDKKMAPVLALAAQNAKLLVQIAETERQLLLTDPDEEGKELLSH